MNRILAKARFCMGAKAGSRAGLQTYDMFTSTWFANYDMFASGSTTQGLQTYDMFASMWLTKISYVCKPCNIIHFLFVGATAMRVAGNKEGNGEGGKGNGDSDKGVRQGTALAMKWAMATATRVAGKEESKRSKGFGGNNKVAGD